MSWLAASALAAALVLVISGAGVAVLTASGLRLREAGGAAPAVGTGVVALTAFATGRLGAPWGLPAVLLGTVVTAVLAAAAAGRLHPRRVRWARASTPCGADPAPRVLTAVGIVLGAGLTLVPLAVAMGRPGRIQNAWDALFHLAVVDLVRHTASADPSPIAALAAPGGEILYPFAWHAFGGLVPAGVDPVTATNVAAFGPTVVVGAAGVAALARSLSGTSRYIPAVAALLTAAAVGAPVSIAIQPGLIANAFGLALVPGVLACVARPVPLTRGVLVPLALAVAGLGLSHGGALLGLALLASPWVVTRAARWAAVDGIRSPRGQRRSLTLAVCALAATVAVSSSSTASAVASTRVKPPVPAGELAGRLLTGDLGEWHARSLVMVGLAVTGAVVLARGRRHRSLVLAAGLAVGAYVCAASPWPLVSSLTGLWYAETRRIAPLVGLSVTLLAAFGLVTLAGASRALAARHASATGASAVAWGCAGILLVAAVAPGVLAVRANALDTFTQAVPPRPQPMSRIPYASAGEEEMFERLRTSLGPDDVVLGSSFSGAGHLAVLTGARAVQPYHTHALSEDALLVSAHVADLGVDPTVCAAVRRIGATHLYTDPYPLHATSWLRTYPAGFTEHPGPATRTIDEGGSARLSSLEDCYPTP